MQHIEKILDDGFVNIENYRTMVSASEQIRSKNRRTNLGPRLLMAKVESIEENRHNHRPDPDLTLIFPSHRQSNLMT